MAMGNDDLAIVKIGLVKMIAYPLSSRALYIHRHKAAKVSQDTCSQPVSILSTRFRIQETFSITRAEAMLSPSTNKI